MNPGTRLRPIAALFSALVLSCAALTGTGAAQAAAVTVRITSTLSPVSVTVPRDTTVTFVNDDGERHRVRTTSGPAEFDSGNLDSGQVFTVTLRSPGTYQYRDERNPDDVAYFGTITVSDSVSTTTTDPTAPPPTTVAAPSAVSVSIGDRVFVPSSVTVAPGGTVTWTNNDDRPHTVTANDRSFDSGILGAGATWSRTFPNGGTFAYFCELHPDMTGTVTVPLAGGGGSPPPPATTPPPTTPPPTTTTTQLATTVPDGGGGGSTAPVTATVVISGNQFTPQVITIVAGGTVTWANADAVPHTVTGATGQFDSGFLRQGDQFSRTFPSVGTFEYLCELHPEMTAKVVVVRPGSPATATTQPPSATTVTPVTTHAAANTSPPTSAPTTSAGSATTLASMASVAIAGNRFSPRTITIAVGGTVSWVNQDAVPHTVTATDRSFDSGIMMQGDRWDRTFTSAGTYTYFCEIHPSMTATVVVTSPGVAAPPVVTAGSPSAGPVPAGSNSSVGAGIGGAPGPSAPGSASVGMGDLQFRPATVTVAAGGSVTWTNTDSLPHTVTAADGSFDSGILMPGDTFTRTFATPGDVGYRCTLHPGMNGTVHVVAAVAGSTGDTASLAPGGDETGATRSEQSSSGHRGSRALVERVTVSIDGDAFPAVTTLTAGQTVTWINNDDVAHNVIAHDGSFSSERFMNPGGRFEHSFTEPGIYPYSCDLHPHMRGIIVVLAADEADAATSPVVVVTDQGFEPPDIVVHQGDTVRWEFDGVLPHTATADDGSFDSGILQPGDTFTFTFDTLGTYTYICTLHPFMVGSITVVPIDEDIPDDVSGISALSGGGHGVPTGAAPADPSAESSSAIPMLLAGILAGLALSIVVGIGFSITRSGARSAAPAS